MPINPAGNTYSEDITEDLLYDITRSRTSTEFTPTDVAYDISINNLPFVISANNQNKYQRETAQYKKDQFDNSAEPGEQSLLGWWLRSQTSFHNGAGIKFYEPGTDYQYVSHRFNESRGVDVWTVGEATLLPEVFHAYESSAAYWNAAAGKNGNDDVLVLGDEDGWLKRITLSGNSTATVADFKNGATYPEGHDGTNYSFLSVTTDGSNYYAACKRAIHTGQIDTLTSDEVAINFSTSDRTDLFIKYVKGFILFGLGNTIYNLTIVPEAYSVGGTSVTRTTSTHNHSGATDSLGSNLKTHINPSWIWNDATATPGPIYISGNGGNNGEIWKVLLDETTNSVDLAGATMVLSLPDGELINSIHFYLGYLAVGTNKGVRICQVNSNGDLIMGPLLVETSHSVHGFTERGSYLYAATKIDEGANTNGVLIRIDLSQQFDDGTFAYAYDLEYQSSLDGDSSDCTEVYSLNDRLVMVIQEDGSAGELQVEHTVNNRTSGYLKTGTIRYGTIEPKFFKFLNVIGRVNEGDGIKITTVDSSGNEFDLITLDSISIGSELEIAQPAVATDQIALKFTLINGSPNNTVPVLESYQLKSLPATRRQRLIQYPLSCYDMEMDKFNTVFGYTGRASDLLESLELLEESADFVRVRDYRTNELYTGIIEEVRFSNESSPDKDSNGFGGLLLVTVRKI
jgi:hypothetical protein